jgi:hypothetical protein
MARPRTGTIHVRDGKLFARIDYTDSAGKRRSKEKRVRTKTEGRAVISNFVHELEDHGPDSLNVIGTTFTDLADHLEKHYLIAPEYVNGRKVAGKRSYKDDLGILKILRESFGRMELRPKPRQRSEEFVLRRKTHLKILAIAITVQNRRLLDAPEKELVRPILDGLKLTDETLIVCLREFIEFGARHFTLPDLSAGWASLRNWKRGAPR